MSFRKLGIALSVIGMILLAYSGYSWIGRFSPLSEYVAAEAKKNPVFLALGEENGPITINTFRDCLYSFSNKCEAGDAFSFPNRQVIEYFPGVFWTGLGSLALGMLVLFSKKRENDEKSSLVRLAGLLDAAMILGGLVILVALGAVLMVGLPFGIAPRISTNSALGKPVSSQSDSRGLGQLLNAQDR